MAKKTDRNSFPDKLFVYKDFDGDNVYFIACKTERECASLDEDRLVGVYELKEVGNIVVSIVREAA